MAVQTQPDKVDAPDPHRGIERAALRQIAYATPRLLRADAEHPHFAGGEGDEAQDDPQKDGLADAVRSQYRDEIPSVDRQGDVLPYRAPADTGGGAPELDGG
jgi:hypothetical protein